MRKLKPSVKAAIASTLVLTSAAAIAYAVPKITNEENTKSTGNELKLEVERVDSDTVKVAIDNIQDIPKALQFSIKLEGVKLQDGQGSIRDLVKSEIETRLKNKEYSTSTNDVLTDYTYNEKDNTIDVLITAENSLPKVGNKVEIFELDVKAASKDIQTYKILPNDTSDYKYVSNTNKEYSNLGVTSDNESIYLETLPTITSDDSYIKIVEGETLELTYENLQEKIGLQMSHEDGNNDLTLEVTKDGKVIDKFTENTVGIYKLELRAVKNKTVKSEPLELTVNVALADVTEPPTITRNGEELKDIILDGGSTFKPLENVKAVDKNGRSVEVSVKVDKELNLDPDVDTTYTLTYTATDVYGNTATKKITLTVNANKPPVISGAKDLVLKVGDKFDPYNGVTVSDEDEDIKLEVDSNVNTNIAGEYKVLYSATDSKGKTTKVQIKVTVNPKTTGINNKVPVITVEDITIKVGDEFDPKAIVSVTDEDEDIMSKLVIESDVNTKKAGTYTVKYSVTDSKGATATKTIKVTVLPKSSTEINNKVPIITVEDITIKVGDKFDPKSIVSVTDEDEDIMSKLVIESDVDTTKAGTYTVKYSVTDSKGATATKTIKVIVKKDIVLASDISINDKDNNKIYVGGSKTIIASINKEADMKNIDWKISDESIADLKVNGNEATIIAKSEGEVTLTASTKDGSNLSDTITINIVNFENDSQMPLYVKDVIDTDILIPISGLGTEEYPVEVEMKNITVKELNTFLQGLEKVDYELISTTEDKEFTIYQLKLTNKSILARFMKFIGLTNDTYIKIKVSKSLDNAEEINNKLAQLADEDQGTPEGGDEGQGTPEGEDEDQGTPEGGDEGQVTPEGEDEGQGTPEGEDEDQGTPEGGDEGQGTPEGGDEDQGTPEGGDEDQGTPEGGDEDQGTPEGGDEGQETPEDSLDTPKTGDASILGYIGLASVAAGGIFINRKRRK